MGIWGNFLGIFRIRVLVSGNKHVRGSGWVRIGLSRVLVSNNGCGLRVWFGQGNFWEDRSQLATVKWDGGWMDNERAWWWMGGLMMMMMTTKDEINDNN